MYRLTIHYGRPEDPEVFDEHYFGTHVPLCKPLPGLKAAWFSKPRPLGRGDIPYLVAELDFEDGEAFGVAMESPEMEAVAADAQNLDAPRVMFTGEVWTDG